MKEEAICKRRMVLNDRRNDGLAKDLSRTNVDMRVREFTDSVVWIRGI